MEKEPKRELKGELTKEAPGKPKEKAEDKTPQKKILQWHPAFYAGIQIEFKEEADKLVFENEHQLGTKPKEIDVLVVKKDSAGEIRKNIGRIFKKHNIIEYKSPDDYLSIDDFYKVYGYACFYKADAEEADSIPAKEVTITFACYHYPAKVLRHLEKNRGMRILKQGEGIYYLEGDIFRMQLLLLSRLSRKDNFWLRSMTNRLNGYKEAKKILYEYEKHENENLYQSVMDIIIRANVEIFKEANIMCDALKELLQDELEAQLAAQKELGRQEGRIEGRIEGRQAGRIEATLETAGKLLQKKALSIDEIAECCGLTLEQVKGLVLR